MTLETILLAENDENDVILLRRMLKKCGVLNPLQVVGDGDHVIAYLSGEAE